MTTYVFAALRGIYLCEYRDQQPDSFLLMVGDGGTKDKVFGLSLDDSAEFVRLMVHAMQVHGYQFRLESLEEDGLLETGARELSFGEIRVKAERVFAEDMGPKSVPCIGIDFLPADAELTPDNLIRIVFRLQDLNAPLTGWIRNLIQRGYSLDELIGGPSPADQETWGRTWEPSES